MGIIVSHAKGVWEEIMGRWGWGHIGYGYQRHRQEKRNRVQVGAEKQGSRHEGRG